MNETAEPSASDDILRKIRGLLAKAENTEYGPEQEALMSKASALMAKHRVDEAMLADSKPLDRSKLVTRRVSVGSGPYVNGRLSLLAGIGRQMGVKILTQTTWDGRVCDLYGFETDVSAVELLYTSLLMQMTDAVRTQPVPAGKATVSFRRSFQFGFAVAVENRLAEANRDAASTAVNSDTEGSGRSVALVLADRDAVVNDYMTSRVGKVRGTHRMGASKDRSGFDAGGTAGRKADLSDRRSMSGSRCSLNA